MLLPIDFYKKKLYNINVIRKRKELSLWTSLKELAI